MCPGRVKDAASYETVAHSPLYAGQRHLLRHGGTHRCRLTNMNRLLRVICGVGTSSDTVRHKAAVLHPLTGWGRRPSALPGIAPSADGAWNARVFRPLRRAGISCRARRGSFARCDGRPKALPLETTILGCPPSVGKSGRRGILRQAKVWLRRHTGCMARSHTAGMAEKARRAPQTHGRWAAPQEKNRAKL